MIKGFNDYMINGHKNQANPAIRQIKVQTMWQLFGDKTDEIINELNEVLAA